MIKGQALCPRHKPAGHACTVTAWTADIPADLHRITYVQFGFQERPKAAGTFNDPLAWPGQVEVEETPAALGEMRAWFSLPNGPKHLDCGVFVDDRGARNWIFFAYWLDDDRYAAWPGHTLFDQAASDYAWLGGNGLWREVAQIRPDYMETIQQANREHASMRFFTPKVTEVHEYWGAARDRIPASATDSMVSEAGTALPSPAPRSTDRLRVTMELPGNMCHVRSAQDLMLADRDHLATYVDEVEPSLREGLDYIRSNPVELGALATRYIREVTPSGEPLAKTCGQLFFLSMKHLEKWAASHHTHIRILKQFNTMAVKFGDEMGLALWHEVAVLPKGHLIAEYAGCHGATGFLPYFPERQTATAIS